MSNPNSQGDPRVLFVMNVVLSSAFAAMALWAGSFAGIVEFTIDRFVFMTLLIVLLTHVVTSR